MDELKIEDSFLYETFKEELAQKYAKGNCKTCRGRGYILWDHPNQLIPPHVHYCGCVVKNLTKILEYLNQKVEEEREKERVGG